MKKTRKKNNILKYLTEEEKEHFLDALLLLIKRFKVDKKCEPIEQCIDDWKEVAELNSIPNFKERVWERFNCLKSEGKVC
jgi:hypothetical protein